MNVFTHGEKINKLAVQSSKNYYSYQSAILSIYQNIFQIFISQNYSHKKYNIIKKKNCSLSSGANLQTWKSNISYISFYISLFVEKELFKHKCKIISENSFLKILSYIS